MTTDDADICCRINFAAWQICRRTAFKAIRRCQMDVSEAKSLCSRTRVTDLLPGGPDGGPPPGLSPKDLHCCYIVASGLSWFVKLIVVVLCFVLFCLCSVVQGLISLECCISHGCSSYFLCLSCFVFVMFVCSSYILWICSWTLSPLLIAFLFARVSESCLSILFQVVCVCGFNICI